MRIRLESNEAGDVPRWIAEAVVEYRSPERRGPLIDLMAQKFCKGMPGPPAWAWHGLLSGLSPYIVHAGSITFDVAEPVRA